jgi:hypothetical protein
MEAAHFSETLTFAYGSSLHGARTQNIIIIFIIIIFIITLTRQSRS